MWQEKHLRRSTQKKHAHKLHDKIAKQTNTCDGREAAKILELSYTFWVHARPLCKYIASIVEIQPLTWPYLRITHTSML